MSQTLFDEQVNLAGTIIEAETPEEVAKANASLTFDPDRYRMMQQVFRTCRRHWVETGGAARAIPEFDRIAIELEKPAEEFNALPLALRASVHSFCLVVAKVTADKILVSIAEDHLKRL